MQRTSALKGKGPELLPGGFRVYRVEPGSWNSFEGLYALLRPVLRRQQPETLIEDDRSTFLPLENGGYYRGLRDLAGAFR